MAAAESAEAPALIGGHAGRAESGFCAMALPGERVLAVSGTPSYEQNAPA